MQVLIDPVCMFAIHPCLLQNFIYKLPAVGGPSGWNVLKLIDGIRYLFSRDMVIAESFCRKFAWHKVGCPVTLPGPCYHACSTSIACTQTAFCPSVCAACHEKLTMLLVISSGLR